MALTLQGIFQQHFFRYAQTRKLPLRIWKAANTLLHELLALWEWNRAAMARALFASARDTLMTLLADPRFLGATPGIVMALHTWGRTLNHHPHVHALVSGGGLTAGGDWKAVTN